jgi:hypothetical protein
MPRKTAAKKTADTNAPKRTESGGVKHTTGDGIPASRTDTKDETRLFQRGNGPKVWLTRDEAKNEGFFWEDNPEENVNPPN